MDARKNPEYLKSVALAVADFREALVEFLKLHVVNGEPGGLGGLARGIAPAVFPLDGADPEEIARRQAKVSRAAGRAASAVPLTGIAMGVQGAAWSTPSPIGKRSPGRNLCWKLPMFSTRATKRLAGWKV